jgi:hypothetical protein
MPAPRAVLIDLYENRMDPGKPWTVTDKGGKLSPTPKVGAKHVGTHLNNLVYHAPPKAEEVTKPVEKPAPALKSALVRPAPVAVAPVTEATKEKSKAEEAPAVTLATSEDGETVVLASSKKLRAEKQAK